MKDAIRQILGGILFASIFLLGFKLFYEETAQICKTGKVEKLGACSKALGCSVRLEDGFTGIVWGELPIEGGISKACK